jgi:tetratricopeptide (TPR) repeat protein
MIPGAPLHDRIRSMTHVAAGVLVLAILAPVGAASQATDPVATGDAAWARRAEGHQGGRALPAPIGAAVAAYERALAAQPARLEAAWKLLRALHFEGEYVAADRAEKQRVFDRGRIVAEAAVDRLASRVGGRAKLDALPPRELARALAGVPEAAPVFLWGAVHWGLWGDAFGRLAAARQGVGDRVRRYAEVGTALDERYESAAGHRILGRLHALAPKVPLITGWVDRDRAIAELRRAVALAPDFTGNQLFLAEALLAHQPDKAAEAREILRRLADRPPAPERVVEEEKDAATARALLARP